MTRRNANIAKKPKAPQPTGKACVYLRWEEGFHGDLRPCYDSGPDMWGELTARQLRTLRGLICRYIARCHG